MSDKGDDIDVKFAFGILTKSLKLPGFLAWNKPPPTLSLYFVFLSTPNGENPQLPVIWVVIP